MYLLDHYSLLPLGEDKLKSTDKLKLKFIDYNLIPKTLISGNKPIEYEKNFMKIRFLCM